MGKEMEGKLEGIIQILPMKGPTLMTEEDPLS